MNLATFMLGNLDNLLHSSLFESLLQREINRIVYINGHLLIFGFISILVYLIVSHTNIRKQDGIFLIEKNISQIKQVSCLLNDIKLNK
jgi:hypothetical protein